MNRQTELWTVLRMISFGTEYFGSKRVDAPRLTIELMLSAVLKRDRFRLYLDFEQPLSQDELDRLREMIKRRVAGEPLQYILEEAHFFGRAFVVRPGVLIPRPETEVLVDELLTRSGRFLRGLDIGTGSGAIAVTLAAERQGAEIVAIDVADEAIAVTQENAERHGVKNLEVRKVDLFDDAAVGELGTFDVVACNPPYIADGEIAGLQQEVRDHEPHLALAAGEDGLRFYRRLAAILPKLLRPKGNLFAELGAGQASDARRIFTDAGYRVEIYNDLEKIERVLHAS